MPMLVAASARPTKNEVRLSYPSAAASANAGDDRQDHAEDGGDDRRPADREQVVRPHLEADREQQDHDADLGEHERGLTGRDEPERIGSDEEAAEELADDARLPSRRRISSPIFAPSSRMNRPIRTSIVSSPPEERDLLRRCRAADRGHGGLGERAEGGGTGEGDGQPATQLSP